MNTQRMPAVILAGGKARDALAEAAGVAYKALVPVRGKPMVAHVAQALSDATGVSDLLLVGPPEVAAALPELRHLPDAGSFLGNVSAGVAACGDASHCLVITCDIPFITGEILDAFVARALERDVDLAYPIVAVEQCEERFPGMRRTSLRLREGRFTGGNAVVMRPEFLARNAGLVESAYAARKQPLRLVGMIGWGLVARVLAATVAPWVLPLSLVEGRVARLVGGTVAGITLPYPEIGADIDKPEDLAALGG